MTRIAIFHPSFRSMGGAEYLALYQAQFLREAGHAVQVVTFAPIPRLQESSYQELPTRIIKKRTPMDWVFFWDRIRKTHMRAHHLAPSLADADIVIAHNAPACSMLYLSGFQGQRIWFCHEPPRGLYPFEANPYLVKALQEGRHAVAPHYLRILQQKLAEWTRKERQKRTALAKHRDLDRLGVVGMNKVVVNSIYSRDNATRIYGLQDLPIVNPMVRFPDRTPLRQGRPKRGLRVLVHSRLDLMKNVDTVIQGFAAYRDNRDPDAELHVVGTGEREADLKTFAEEVGQKGIHFHGFLTRMALEGIYAHCDVMVLLPLDEPFGMVFPEAATRGLLMVGSNHGGPMEITEGGRLGWNIEALNSEAVLETLATIAALSDAEIDQKRLAADDACRARYAPHVIGAQFIKALGLHDQ